MGFKDTFGKTGGGEENLEYDDGAFAYFIFSIMFCIQFYFTYSIISKILKKFHYRKWCKCTDCQKNKDGLINVLTKRKYNKYFYIKVIFSALLYVSMFFTYQYFSNLKQAPKFDPYEILDIADDADIRTIKKAYRQLTIKYHPDKNQDPDAEKIFIRISKAYEVLTDPKVSELYQKYGNPDGEKNFSVSIAFPSFLLNPDHHIMILSIFFTALLVFVPFYQYNVEKLRYDFDGVLVSTKQTFSKRIKPNLKLETAMIIISEADEFMENNDMEGFDYLYKKVPKGKDLENPKYLALIYYHVSRKKIPLELQEDYDLLLEFTPKLINIMIDVAFQKVQKGSISADVAYELIFFRQMFIQALAEDASSLQTIPLIKMDHILEIEKRFDRLPILKNLFEFNDVQFNRFFFKFTSEEKNQIQDYMKYIPQYKMWGRIYIDNHETIHEMDLFTIEINIERINCEQNGKANYVHAPFMKQKIKERLYMMIFYDSTSKMINQSYKKSQKKLVQYKYKTRISKAGEHRFIVFVRNDCYKGLDHRFEINVEIKEALKKENFVYHQEDKDLDKVQLFFEQLNDIKNQSDDEIEENEKEPAKQENKQSGERLEQESNEDDNESYEEESDNDDKTQDIQMKPSKASKKDIKQKKSDITQKEEKKIDQPKIEMSQQPIKDEKKQVSNNDQNLSENKPQDSSDKINLQKKLEQTRKMMEEKMKLAEEKFNKANKIIREKQQKKQEEDEWENED